MNLYSLIQEIQQEGSQIPIEEIGFRDVSAMVSRAEKFQQLMEKKCQHLDQLSRSRVFSEFEAWGPLEELLQNENITEILINSPSEVWFELNGQLRPHHDHFACFETYRLFIDRLCMEANVHFNKERPMTDGKIKDFRLHIASHELTHTYDAVSLRRHPKNPWTLESLIEKEAMNVEQKEIIESILLQRENFLVIGATGSGKTSLLGACLKKIPDTQRVLILEDTDELTLPNKVSNKMLTRQLAHGTLSPIDQMELLKQALRMRPDRLVMGEIRGAEAKDLLMALSTGHGGSFATLHAQDPQQALLRLEMLIQLAAPQWSLSAIRTLIFLGLQYILVAGKDRNGKRKLQGIHKITSREESGVLLEKIC